MTINRNDILHDKLNKTILTRTIFKYKKYHLLQINYERHPSTKQKNNLNNTINYEKIK